MPGGRQFVQILSWAWIAWSPAPSMSQWPLPLATYAVPSLAVPGSVCVINSRRWKSGDKEHGCHLGSCLPSCLPSLGSLVLWKASYRVVRTHRSDRNPRGKELSPWQTDSNDQQVSLKRTLRPWSSWTWLHPHLTTWPRHERPWTRTIQLSHRGDKLDPQEP